MEFLKRALLFIIKIAAMTLLAIGMSALAVHIVDFVLGTNYASADNIGMMALFAVALHFGFWEPTDDE